MPASLIWRSPSGVGGGGRPGRAEQSLSRRAQGIAAQDLAAAQLLAQEGRGEAESVDDRSLQLSDADEDPRALRSRPWKSALPSVPAGRAARVVLGSDPPCAVVPRRESGGAGLPLRTPGPNSGVAPPAGFSPRSELLGRGETPPSGRTFRVERDVRIGDEAPGRFAHDG